MNAGEVLAEVARALWHDTHDGAECPDDAIPTPGALCEWWTDNDPDPTGEGADRMVQLLGEGPWVWRVFRYPRQLDEGDIRGRRIGFRSTAGGEGAADHDLSAIPVSMLVPDLRYDEEADEFIAPAQNPFHVLTIARIHQLREAAPKADRPRHPLAPLVAAWQARPVEVAPETRPTAILPESLRAARIAAFAGGADPQLPLILTGGELGELGTAPVQGTLFDFEAPSTSLVPVLPLQLWRNAGGADRTRGRGAPISKRVWWAAIANTGTGFRVSDGSVRLRTTLRDLNEWLYPGQRWHPRNLERLRFGLWEADAIRVNWERRDWRIVGVEALPEASTRLDDPLPIRVAMPPGSEHGALIDKRRMYAAGGVSGPVLDACIRLAYLWDAAKVKTGGRRIYATRPRVLRDDRGRLTDAAGRLITGPDPALSWDRRRKVPADRPAMNWRDSRAVVVGEERSPAADHVPELDRRDLVRLFHGDIETDGARLRMLTFEARRMLREHFEEPGYVVVEERLRGREFEAVRILEPRPKSDASFTER